MTSRSRSILITGASSGIGRATALRLARTGWRVFAAVRKETDAEQIKAEASGALESVRLDVGEKASIAAAAAEVESRLNGRGLDGLFNNAGIGSSLLPAQKFRKCSTSLACGDASLREVRSCCRFPSGGSSGAHYVMVC